jgi:hypothetical protein
MMSRENIMIPLMSFTQEITSITVSDKRRDRVLSYEEIGGLLDVVFLRGENMALWGVACG